MKRWFDKYLWWWQRKYIKDIYIENIPFEDDWNINKPCSGKNLVLELKDGRKYYDSMLMQYFSNARGYIPQPAFKVRINEMMEEARKKVTKDEVIYKELLKKAK
jgi:hypothetical protein